jgi:hypothetical protein
MYVPTESYVVTRRQSAPFHLNDGCERPDLGLAQ